MRGGGGGVIKLSGSFLHTQSIFVDFQHVQDGSVCMLWKDG